MSMRNRIIPRMVCGLALGAMFLGLLAGQEAGKSLGYETLLDQALKAGPDFASLSAQWSVSQEAYAQALAKIGVNLSANASYSLAGGGDSTHVDGQADATLTSAGSGNMSGVSNSLSLPQSLGGGVTMTAGNTKASLTASQSLPVQLKTTGSTQEGINPGTFVLAGTVSQVLWDGYAGGLPLATVQKAQATLDAQESTYQANLLSLVNKFQTSFFTLVQAQETVKVYTKIRDQKKLAAELLKTRFALNQASEMDTRTAALNLRSAEEDLKAALQSRLAASMRLAIAAGLSPQQDLEVQSPPDPELPGFAEDWAVKTALEHRADLNLLVQNLNASLIDQAVYQAQLAPVVTLSGTPSVAYKWDTGGFAFALGANVKLSLPMSDAGLTSHQTASAQSLQDSYRIQADQLKKNIETDTRDYYRQLATKYERWLIAKESSALAQRQYDIVNTAVEFGTGKPKDLFDASVTLVNALNAEIVAKTAVYTAWGQLSASMAFDPRNQTLNKE